MQYFVISPDGSKYGPADIPTLKQWAAENRLFPNSMLEDFGTGQRMEASQVQGIFSDNPPAPGTTVAQPGTMAPPGAYNYGQAPTPAGYPRAGAAYGDDGSSDVRTAWIFGVLGLFCCGLIFGLLGLQSANRALAKGNQSANGPRILCIIDLVLWAIFVVVRIGALALTSSGR